MALNYTPTQRPVTLALTALLLASNAAIVHSALPRCVARAWSR